MSHWRLIGSEVLEGELFWIDDILKEDSGIVVSKVDRVSMSDLRWYVHSGFSFILKRFKKGIESQV